MNRDNMRPLALLARVARLATVSAGGDPHLVPVCFVLVGDVLYSAVDHKPKRRPRLRRIIDIEQTGRASVLVDEYNEDWSALWWVRMEGPARLVTDPAEAGRAISALVEKYPQYERQQPDGPVLAVDVRRWTGWSAGEAQRR